MKHLLFGLLLSIGSILYAANTDTVFYEFWNINSLTNIGGYDVTMYGEPIVVDTEKGKAVQFDGVNDALIIDKNPFMDTKEFTFEVLFKPNGGQPNIANEPRFVCFWDPDNTNGPRMTIEIRVTASNEWYFDGFLKTDKEQLTLIDSTKTHPVDQWMHAAVTYKDSIFTTYVNGEQELSDTVGYSSKVFNSTGRTSVGARYNFSRWYNGALKAIKVTHKALTPSEFFSIPDTIVTSEVKVSSNGNILEIYPVPANNNLYINTIRDNYLPISATITNSTGQIVYQSKLIFDTSDTAQAIDISSFHNGMYFVRLQLHNYIITREIFVLR